MSKIASKNISFQILEQLKKMSEQCTKCDNCTQACPLIGITKDDNLWGIFFDVDKDIWNCSSCFRCEASCPVDLSVRDAFFKKRRLLKVSELPVKYQQYFKNILENGNVFEIDELFNERRKTLGLDPINFEKIKKEIKQLLDESE